MTRTRVQAIIAIAAAVWIGLLFLHGVPLSLSYLLPYSLVVNVVLVVMYVFNKWLWRLPLLSTLFNRPVLAGTWKGELRSTWKDQHTGAAGEPVLAFLVVRQTYESLSIQVVTAESESESLNAVVQGNRDGVPEVVTIYRANPKLLLRARSPIHYGAMRLRVHRNPALRLEGEYWTDRDTKGQAVFSEHVSKVYSAFSSACEAMVDTP